MKLLRHTCTVCTCILNGSVSRDFRPPIVYDSNPSEPLINRLRYSNKKKLRGAHPTAESRKQNISKNSAVYIVPESLTFAQRSPVQLRDHLQWSSCTAGSFCNTVKSQGREGDLPLRLKKVPRLVNHGYTHDTTTQPWLHTWHNYTVYLTSSVHFRWHFLRNFP